MPTPAVPSSPHRVLSVLILGATSAIASAVADRLAARGDRLFLVGRNPEKLAALAARLGPAVVGTRTADFDELDRAPALVEEALARLGGVDLALVAHGDLGDQVATERDFAAAEKVLRTNLLSVVALLIPLANALEAARGGKLAVITSVAAERGRPRNYTYASAKGALNVYLQGLRTRLYAAGVTVTTLKVGPIDTPMTATHKKNPLFSTPAAIAPEIIRAIDDGTPEAFVPWYWRGIMTVVRGTPERLVQKLPFLSGR